jgi:class 3 adenylate cyclase
LFFSWGFWDLKVYPEPYCYYAFALRFLVTAPGYAALMVALKVKGYERYMQSAAAFLGFLSFLYTMILVQSFPQEILISESSGMVLITVYFYTASRLRFLYSAPVGVLAYLAYTFQMFFLKDLPASMVLNNTVSLGTANALGVIIAFLVERLSRENFQNSNGLHLAKEKIEQLLHLTLPIDIAKRLQDVEGRPHLADYFHEATIMFVDIVNFTETTQRMSPENLVHSLDEIFSQFDELTDQFGLEKVKTIGDAYMVVGGVPKPRPDHAEAMIRLAFEFRKYAETKSFGDGMLRLRIGIHTGPLVAGVIGNKRFLYDLWGDAVNTASRMESAGVPNQIQISEATHIRTSELFNFTSRGFVEIKGKGQMMTFLVESEKTAGTATPAASAA